MTKNIKIVLGVIALGAVLYFVFKKPEKTDSKENTKSNVDSTKTPTNSKPNA